VVVAGLLQAGEGGEALAGVLDEALLHLEGKAFPFGGKANRINPIAVPQLFVDDAGKDGLEVGEAAGAGQLGDGGGKLAARGVFIGHLQEQFAQPVDLDGHGAVLRKRDESWG